jgi:hypothetical protein
LETEAVLMADSLLDFIIERLSGFLLRSDIPKDLEFRINSLLDFAYEVRDFLYANFEDIYKNRGNYSFQSL